MQMDRVPLAAGGGTGALVGCWYFTKSITPAALAASVGASEQSFATIGSPNDLLTTDQVLVLVPPGAPVFAFTVSGASTLAFTNVPSSGWAVVVTLLITNGSAFALTFPASVTWPSGIAPTFKASGVDIVDLETKDAGATWYATLRNLRPGVLKQFAQLTTTSGTDASLASYALAAGALASNGHALRVTIAGTCPAGEPTVNLKFGARDVAKIVLPAN